MGQKITWETILSKPKIEKKIRDIKTFLHAQIERGATIFPPDEDILAALNKTPFEDIKVVILGQDPYHRDRMANGLAFSVQPDTKKLPPSLQNIFKELYNDVKIQNTNGCLKNWAEQGVLLLNATLTVEQGKPSSHKRIGWKIIIDHIISEISAHKETVVYVLWGKDANSKRILIDESKHHVLTSTHPSPFSAHNGFFGSKPFSRINKFLSDNNMNTIDWGT